MTEDANGATQAQPEAAEDSPRPQPAPSEREVSTTVGTGSYVAISCTVMALLVTFAILGVLFVLRWLS